MTNKTFIWMAAAAVIGFASCTSAPEGETVETGEAQAVETLQGDNSFTVDQGVMYWTGYGVGKQHTGEIKISEGQLSTSGTELVSGSFTIDINSLTVTDLDEDNGKSKLEGHLKSGDFFQGDQYPTGTFEITAVTPKTGTDGVTHSITGNLTLKGITKSITFDAEIMADAQTLRARTPDFKINRTEWNVMYGSDLIGTAKDKLISNDVTLSLGFTAQRNAQ
jgi:polyisoprenoid-binding protein YceI